jgi:hypothetical protein
MGSTVSNDGICKSPYPIPTMYIAAAGQCHPILVHPDSRSVKPMDQTPRIPPRRRMVLRRHSRETDF